MPRVPPVMMAASLSVSAMPFPLSSPVVTTIGRHP
jgi:hypothetical protein